MMHSKGWMIAGATAGLLLSGAARASEDPADAEQQDSAGVTEQRGAEPGGDSMGGTGSGSGSGAQLEAPRPGAGEGPVPSNWIDGSGGGEQAGARTATRPEMPAHTDASELAAGNTGGRG